jgi:2-amino-4-hydroxy-6-hydroxymethyldihydropteridine diphosphokinase
MILIAFGSNLTGPWGTPRQTVQRAAQALDASGVRVLQLSALIETAPYGKANQPSFINAVAVVETHKSPDALMRCLHMIERRAGRQRRLRWGPRTLDLDLIDYRGLVRQRKSLDVKPLVLPHPGTLFRRFVLQPIADVAPRWRHPVSYQTAAERLKRLRG